MRTVVAHGRPVAALLGGPGSNQRPVMRLPSSTPHRPRAPHDQPASRCRATRSPYRRWRANRQRCRRRRHRQLIARLVIAGGVTLDVGGAIEVAAARHVPHDHPAAGKVARRALLPVAPGGRSQGKRARRASRAAATERDLPPRPVASGGLEYSCVGNWPTWKCMCFRHSSASRRCRAERASEWQRPHITLISGPSVDVRTLGRASSAKRPAADSPGARPCVSAR